MKTLEKIREIIERKEKAGIEPAIALLNEIVKESELSNDEIRKEVRQLIKEKKIVYGQTLNDFYFKFKKLWN